MVRSQGRLVTITLTLRRYLPLLRSFPRLLQQQSLTIAQRELNMDRNSCIWNTFPWSSSRHLLLPVLRRPSPYLYMVRMGYLPSRTAE